MDKDQSEIECIISSPIMLNALRFFGFTHKEISDIIQKSDNTVGRILKNNDIHNFYDKEEQEEIDVFLDEFFYYLGFDKLFSIDILRVILKNLDRKYDSNDNERELMRKLLIEKSKFNNGLTVILHLLKQVHNSNDNIGELDAHDLLEKYFQFKAVILTGDGKKIFKGQGIDIISENIIVDKLSYEDTYKSHKNDDEKLEFYFRKCCEIIGWKILLERRKAGMQAWNENHFRIKNNIVYLGRNNEKTASLNITVQLCSYASLLGTNYGIMKDMSLIDQFTNREARAKLRAQLYELMDDSESVNLKPEAKVDIQENILGFLDAWPDKIGDNSLELKVREISKLFINKEKEAPAELALSRMANLLSVNIALITSSDVLIIQKRGEYSAHANTILLQTSAAGFVDCSVDTKFQNDGHYVMDLHAAIRNETKEETGIEFDDIEYSILGAVRDKTNYEVGIMAFGIVNKWRDDWLVNPAIEHGHSEVKGYYFVRFNPRSVFKFILNVGSNRGRTREPWNDIMPLGAASILFALANRYDWDIMKKEWNDCFEQWSKYGKVK